MIKLLARQGARRSIDRDPGRQVNVQRSIGRCVRQGNAGGRNQAWGAPDEAQARRHCPPWDARSTTTSRARGWGAMMRSIESMTES